ELWRAAKRGFRGAMLPAHVDLRPYNDPAYEPLWAVAEELGVPLTFHAGTGRTQTPAHGPGGAVVNYVVTVAGPMETVAFLCSSGVLERHPKLRVVMVECGSGWVAWRLHVILVAQRGPVTRSGHRPVEGARAAHDLHPGVPAGCEGVDDLLARREPRREDAGVLVQGDRALAPIARGHHAQPALHLRGRERALLVAGRELLPLGQDPDLEKVHGLGARRVVLAVRDAGAGGHALHLAGADDGAVAHAVLVL